MTLGQSSYDPASMNQDIGWVSIEQNFSWGDIVWLTDTPDINEADSSVVQWNPVEDTSGTEQYVVGWAEPGYPYVYKLARTDTDGNILEGPTDISSLAQWGRRDDPMRRHYNDDIVWAWFDSPGSTTLNFARLVSGN
jgi:hypothetical protein